MREAESSVTPLDLILRVLQFLAKRFDQLQTLRVELDVGQEVFCDVLELVLAQVLELFAEPADGFGEQVVDDVPALRMQLVQEQLDLFFYPIILVFKQHADIDDFSFELEHVVQDQVGDDHEALLPDVNFSIMQQHKDVLDSLVQEIWEAIEQVGQRDYDVGLYSELDI